VGLSTGVGGQECSLPEPEDESSSLGGMSPLAESTSSFSSWTQQWQRCYAVKQYEPVDNIHHISVNTIQEIIAHPVAANWYQKMNNFVHSWVYTLTDRHMAFRAANGSLACLDKTSHFLQDCIIILHYYIIPLHLLSFLLMTEGTVF
jgi:hypothetical protein